jgi:rRNA maturation endonuclease Nob1
MEIATYYVTLQPTHDKGRNADGMHHIAFVDDPAIEEVGIYLKKHDPRMVAEGETKSKILEYLSGCGQEVPANWREVTDEEYLAAKEIELTTDPTSRESFNDFTNPKGGGQWLVRYKYFTPDGSPVIETTRDFCRDIISLNRIYTEEEIQNGLSNPEFGNYSIFDYKGSYGCRHVWKRQIYYEDYEDNEVRKVGFVPRVVSRLDDSDATTLNAFLSKDEKMQVCAPLLIPDKDVYRNDEIGKYNMRFSAQTISDLRTLAASKGVLERKDLFKNTHEGGTAPSYVIKEWIIEDENDPAYTDYGFDVRRVPIGSWMVLSQITDKEFWNKEIKGNKKYAYSIEALINLTIIKMQKMENEKIAIPDGEHLINGTIYVFKDGQAVSTQEITEQQEEVIEEVVETAAEKPVEELSAEVNPEVEQMAEVVEEVKTEVAPEDDRMSKLESQLGEMVTEVASLRAMIEKPAVEETVDVQMAKVPLWKTLAALRSKN